MGRRRGKINSLVEDAPNQPKITQFFPSGTGANGSQAQSTNPSMSTNNYVRRNPLVALRRTIRQTRRTTSGSDPPVITISDDDEDVPIRSTSAPISGSTNSQILKNTASVDVETQNIVLNNADINTEIIQSNNYEGDEDFRNPVNLNARSESSDRLIPPIRETSVDNCFSMFSNESSQDSVIELAQRDTKMDSKQHCNQIHSTDSDSTTNSTAYMNNQLIATVTIATSPGHFSVSNASVYRRLNFDEDSGSKCRVKPEITSSLGRGPLDAMENTLLVEDEVSTSEFDSRNNNSIGSPSMLGPASASAASTLFDYTLPKHIFEDEYLENEETANLNGNLISNGATLHHEMRNNVMSPPKTPAKKNYQSARKLTPKSKSPKISTQNVRVLRKLQRSKVKSSSPRKLFQSPNRTGSSGSSTSSATQSPVKPIAWNRPYYLRNFLTVLNNVMSDDHHKHLFNEDDTRFFSTFNSLSFEAQKLYVRLFHRKWDWKVRSSIKYDDIAMDLKPALLELHRSAFLNKIDGK